MIPNLKYTSEEGNKEIRSAGIASSVLKGCKTILIF